MSKIIVNNFIFLGLGRLFSWLLKIVENYALNNKSKIPNCFLGNSRYFLKASRVKDYCDFESILFNRST